MNSTKVFPQSMSYRQRLQVDDELSHKWKEAQLQILTDIQTLGHVKPQYKLGAFKRMQNVLATTLCCGTICLPCVTWDTVCCCLSTFCLKENPCKWGCTFKIAADSCAKTFADKREELLNDVKPCMLNLDMFIDVCTAYVRVYDEELEKKSSQGALRANIIRERVFIIAQRYGPLHKYIFLKDHGDNINEIRMLLASIREDVNDIHALFR